MSLWSSIKKGFAEAKQERIEKKLLDFEYRKTILEKNIDATRTNHILHFLLTVLTAGVWIIMWMFVAWNNSSKRTNYQRELKKLHDFKNKYDNHKTLDDTDKLYKLSLMLKDGYITQKEFDKQKSKLLL